MLFVLEAALMRQVHNVGLGLFVVAPPPPFWSLALRAVALQLR